jgi:hypothetical protein
MKIVYFNPGEINLGILDIAAISLVIAGILTFLFMPALLFRRSGRLAVYGLIGLVSAALVNTFFVISASKVLDDGSAIAHSLDYGRLAVTAAAVAGSIILGIFHNRHISRSIIQLGLTGVFSIAAGFSLLALWNAPPSQGSEIWNAVSAPEHGIELSPQKNILVLSFDQIQGSVTAGVLRRNRSLAKKYDGFVVFPDAASVYPNTNYSLASTLAGKMTQKKSDDFKKVVRGRNFVRSAMANGFAGSIAIGDMECNICVSKGSAAFERDRIGHEFLQLLSLASGQAFGGGAGAIVWAMTPIIGMPLGKTAVDWIWKLDIHAFTSSVDRMTVASEKPVVQFRHYYATHQPVMYNEQCALVAETEVGRVQSLAGVEGEVICVLQSVARMIDKLKEQGLYEQTMIIITSDHGYETNINADDASPLADELLFEGSAFVGVDNIKPVGSYNPTIFFKDFGSRGAVRESAAHVSLLDIAATVCESIGTCHADFEGRSLRSDSGPRERRYWRYFGGVEHRMDGGVDRLHYGLDKWWEVRTFEGSIKDGLARSMAAAPSVSATGSFAGIGDRLGFEQGGLGNRFKAGGFSDAEHWGSWTLGKRASLIVPMNAAPSRLTMNASAFVPREHDKMNISVSLNGHKLGSALYTHGSSQQTFSFPIPPELLDGSTITIDLEMDNPQTPAELGLSRDARPLGIALSWISFS